MRERPIIFSGPMVRAILDGRKTQTRRILKSQPAAVERWRNGGPTTDTSARYAVMRDTGGKGWANCGPFQCPFGQPGDRLWVRETHAIVPRTAYARSEGVEQVLRPDDDHDACVFRDGWERSRPGRWRPSIHMPRWASRITLEITGVRLERLQDISEADAIGEGIERRDDFFGCACWVSYYNEDYGADVVFPDDPIGSYRSLWESLHGPGAWAANPFVWVLEFRRVAKEAGE